jgi:hypothetical protein
VACASAMLACGGDHPGRGRYSSGIDGTRPLVDLTADETGHLCMSSQSWATEAIPVAKRAAFVCKSGAVVAVLLAGALSGASGFQQKCQRTYLGCLDASSMAPTAIMCPRAGPTCTATVADYETCLNDFPASFDEAIAAIPSCDKLTPISIVGSSLVAASILPPSCTDYQMKCPGSRVTGLPGTPGP